MAVTPTDLLEYLGAPAKHLPYVTDCLARAQELLAGFLRTESVRVPTLIQDQCALIVGAELFNKRQTKNAVQQFATQEGTVPQRTYRDPLTEAYPLIYMFIPRGFA